MQKIRSKISTLGMTIKLPNIINQSEKLPSARKETAKRKRRRRRRSRRKRRRGPRDLTFLRCVLSRGSSISRTSLPSLVLLLRYAFRISYPNIFFVLLCYFLYHLFDHLKLSRVLLGNLVKIASDLRNSDFRTQYAQVLALDIALLTIYEVCLFLSRSFYFLFSSLFYPVFFFFFVFFF